MRSLHESHGTKRHPVREQLFMTSDEIDRQVREVLALRAKIPMEIQSVSASQSLYDAGMTSHATVRVMLGLEDQFDVEFPDELLQRSVFDQIESIVQAIEKLLTDQ